MFIETAERIIMRESCVLLFMITDDIFSEVYLYSNYFFHLLQHGRQIPPFCGFSFILVGLIYYSRAL